MEKSTQNKSECLWACRHLIYQVSNAAKFSTVKIFPKFFWSREFYTCFWTYEARSIWCLLRKHPRSTNPKYSYLRILDITNLKFLRFSKLRILIILDLRFLVCPRDDLRNSCGLADEAADWWSNHQVREILKHLQTCCHWSVIGTGRKHGHRETGTTVLVLSLR